MDVLHMNESFTGSSTGSTQFQPPRRCDSHDHHLASKDPRLPRKNDDKSNSNPSDVLRSDHTPIPGAS
ncbi:hypothetical protein WG66_007411 [Moniliophthora roreri]|nr:hypothetical protein WG66_007411 [Moniliophthora roreri]